MRSASITKAGFCKSVVIAATSRRSRHHEAQVDVDRRIRWAG
jgi:hypothetical protein